MDIIPNDAVVVFSSNNDDPLMNRYSNDRWVLGKIASVSETIITTTQDDPHDVGGAFYLGALVSQDRETVYWENTMRPLP